MAVGSGSNDTDISAKYTYGQYRFNRRSTVTPNADWVVRGEIQYTNDHLPVGERYSIGGGNVRGYYSDPSLATLAARAAWSTSFPDRPLSGRPTCKWFFFDIGSAQNVEAIEGIYTDTLANVGLGLRYRLGEILNFQLDYGRHLREWRPMPEETLKGEGWYGSIQLTNPF